MIPRALLLPLVATGCVGEIVGLAEDPPDDGPGDEAAVGWVRTFAPSDFDDGRLAFWLPAAPEGRTVAIAVPALSSLDYRAGRDLNGAMVSLRFSLTGGGAGELAGRVPPLAPAKIDLSEWAAPAVGAPSELPDERTFQIYDPSAGYVPVSARRAAVSAHYAFYEDAANTANFSEAGYAEMVERVEGAYEDLVAQWGHPTDLDGNGHLLVLLSATLAGRSGGQAYVDGCNLGVGGGCGDTGEIIYFWSLDALQAASGQDELTLAGDYYPRNILHEMVHVQQFSHAWRRLGHGAYPAAPSFLREGDAETARFLAGLGTAERWSEVSRLMAGGAAPEALSPWLSDYTLGSVAWRYLEERFGAGVHQAFLDGLYAEGPDQEDLVARATGEPEGLVWAMMIASLALDGTALGSATGLEFPMEDIEELGARPPLLPLAVGETSEVARPYAGFAAYELESSAPTRVVIEATADLAFVLVAQP